MHVKKNSRSVSTTRLIIIKCTHLCDHPLGQNVEYSKHSNALFIQIPSKSTCYKPWSYWRASSCCIFRIHHRADAKATVSLGCSQPRTTHGQSLEPDHSCPMQDSSNSLSLLSGPYRLGHDLFRATLQLTKFSFCVALFLWKPGWYCGLRLVHLRPLPFPFALCRHFPNKSLTLLILSWCLLPRGR